MKTKSWINTLMWFVGILWIGVGLRDLFAPHFFSPNVASTSTIILDFAVGAIFLFSAFMFYRSKPRDKS
jgi:hypothetical protein